MTDPKTIAECPVCNAKDDEPCVDWLPTPFAFDFRIVAHSERSQVRRELERGQ
ncbi:hypothetical protein [Qipengyuania atrilutea]|uniref:Uncharacterized protein n=1 Tax=Qipengyuania atrilutea TaxID=2744473 RepID=A0A850H1A5_9SPHN|nr:hypothetical protein [Actirhodobacter atriluteus]NVD45721.1 hypothetical protein [Actirhodobacter atriluteus]